MKYLKTHLGIGTLRYFLQVILSACRYSIEEYFFRYPASQCHAHAVEKLLFGVQILFFRQVLSVAKAFTSGYYGDLNRWEQLTD